MSIHDQDFTSPRHINATLIVCLHCIVTETWLSCVFIRVQDAIVTGNEAICSLMSENIIFFCNPQSNYRNSSA